MDVECGVEEGDTGAGVVDDLVSAGSMSSGGSVEADCGKSSRVKQTDAK